MAHLGFLCPEMTGHLHPMMSLARELERRGHRATFYQRPITCAKVTAAGFACRAYGTQEFPIEVMKAELAALAALKGLAALAHTAQMFARQARAALADLPPMLAADGVEFLMVDQALGAGSTVAELAGLPSAVACNALVLDQEPDVPPFCLGWAYRGDWVGRVRNAVGYRVIGRATRPVFSAINEVRGRHGLPPVDGFAGLAGRARAVVSQLPPLFDFPRTRLRKDFHYVGPMVDADVRPPAPFPYDRLDGRPLVYASMGTLQNGVRRTFGTIAAACAGLGVQLVISLGGGGDPADLGDLPGDPIVVGFAPQLDLIKRSALCITHAGLNTALECLTEGVPMVAIPVTNDQPGVAARIKYRGAGEVVPLGSLTADRLRAAVRRVLADDAYRRAAGRLRDDIARCGGARQGADVVEASMN